MTPHPGTLRPSRGTKELSPRSPVVEARLVVRGDLVVEPPHGRSHADLRGTRLLVQIVRPKGSDLTVDGRHAVQSFPVLQPEVISDRERPEQAAKAEDGL